MKRLHMEGSLVLCRYFFQQMMTENENLPNEECFSSILLSGSPTLAELRYKFPFVGNYHFRLQLTTKDGTYCWLDLIDPARALPVGKNSEICVKVLQLSEDSDKNSEERVLDVREDRQFDAFFRRQQIYRGESKWNGNGVDGGSQDVGAVLSGVKKALASKMKQSGLGQSLQKQSAKIWEKVTGNVSGRENVPPTAESLSQLAKLVGGMKTTLSENNREHMEFLTRLGQCCFESQPFSVRGSAWLRLGFRSEDPLQELQHLLPLQCLVFFHEVHGPVANSMLRDQADGGPNTYLYGVVATNLSYMIADILQLRDGACLGLERPFWRLFEDPVAFFELFSILFKAFDGSWKARCTKVSDIGYHLDYTADFAQELLHRGPESVPALIDYAHQMLKW